MKNEHFITAMTMVPYIGMQYACRCGELIDGAKEWDIHREENK